MATTSARQPSGSSESDVAPTTNATPDMPLDRLETGHSGRVTRIDEGSQIRRRLFDLGIVPGTLIKSVQTAAGGDPTAYLIRGAVIAIRNTDACHVWVQTEGKDQ